MKARVKATGEIVEVIAVGDYLNEAGTIIGEYKDINGMPYNSYDLDFYIEENITIPDYWERLKHQAAISAIQGILSNDSIYRSIEDEARFAIQLATALVKKLKEEEIK